MNSPPLSVSIPRIGKGNRVRARWRAASTASRLRCRRGRHTLHPVVISVSVSVYGYPPRCWYHNGRARSASKKPGRISFHSANVRIGICCFSSVPSSGRPHAGQPSTDRLRANQSRRDWPHRFASPILAWLIVAPFKLNCSRSIPRKF